jgi:hypothetical protein
MAASLVPNYTTNENDNETSESDDGEPTIDHAAMMKPLNASTLVGSMDLAPAVVSKSEIGGTMHVDPTTKQLHYNPKYDQLFKPMVRHLSIIMIVFDPGRTCQSVQVGESTRQEEHVDGICRSGAH